MTTEDLAQTHSDAQTYKPLIFKEMTNEDQKALAREIAKDWLNFLFRQNNSISQWKKVGGLSLEGKDSNGNHIKTIVTFNKAVEYIIKNKNIDSNAFGVFDEKFVPWPDASGSISMKSYWANQATNWQPQRVFMGNTGINNFPLTPGIDREGIVISPLHPHLSSMIIETRKRLVESSSTMFNLHTGWLQDLMSYFNLSVSIVEAFLTQIYYKAKYDPMPGYLIFDQGKMGEIHNRRLNDKLAWIKYTTGRPLEGANKETKQFSTLREIRNHLNHFDPPGFAATIEDVSGWLNMILDVARLLWKMRRHLKIPPDSAVVRLLFQEHVEFVPHDTTIKRIPQTAGYATCKWKHSNK